MRFNCKICDKSFKKFVLFEGHFDFNTKCRENHSNFVQCYICSQEFRHSAALKYHLQQHRVKYVAKVPKMSPARVIPKITLRKEWNFKIVPQVQENDSCEEAESHNQRFVDEPPRSSEADQSVVAPTDVVLQLDTHQNIDKVPSLPRHQCTICKIQLSRGGLRMERHLRVHTEGKYKCKVCNIKFTKLTLNIHLKKFHGKQWIKGPGLIRCNICKAPVKGRSMDAHLLVHKLGKFKCELCNGIRFTSTSLMWHRKREHPGIDFTFNKRECNICKVQLSSAKNLRRHMKVHEIGTIKCEICDIRFTYNSLVFHRSRFHPELVKFQACRSQMDHHADMHQNGQFRCNICQISFTKDALQTHNNRYHFRSDLSAQCSICTLKFTSAVYLEQHKKVHEIGDVECEICQIKFTNNSLLFHQRRFHPNLKVPKPLNPAAAIRKAVGRRLRRERIRHEQTALALKLQCKVCKLRFSEAKKLETHMQVHVDGDVVCRICKVPFTKNALTYHEKKFHPEMVRKDRILKALQRHLADELNSLNESDSKEIPIILEDQYQLLLRENNVKNQCIVCKLQCGEAARLDEHIKVHINGEYKCDICSIWFTKSALVCHQQRVHLEFFEERVSNGIRLTKQGDDTKENKFSEKKGSPVYRCDVCQIKCCSSDQLADHKRVHVVGTVKCTICNIKFTEHSLRYHLKRFHPEFHQEIPRTEYKCTFCTITAVDAKRLETHMTVHTGADTKCDLCDIPFTKTALIIHMRRIHPDLHATVMVQKALERHNMSTEEATAALASDEPNENKYRCSICKVVSLDRKKFYEHMKLHAEGDLMCQVCKIWFTKKSLYYHNKRCHPDIPVTRETREEHKCPVCTLYLKDEVRFKEHMKVHQGDLMCQICKIAFTKASLSYHYKRFHPNAPKKDHILKAIENCASKKSLHSCNLCGKSFTRICYLTLHKKTHRNGTEQIEIPLDFSAPPNNYSENTPISCPTDVKPDTPNNENAPTVSLPDDHYTEQIVYEEWVNPLDVYLSNWNPADSREIILNQPLVLVENLDVRNFDLKSLRNFGRTNKNSIEEAQEKNGNLPETNLPNMDVDSECNLQPDTTQKDCDEIFEILSDDDEDCETIRYQLNNNAYYKAKQFKVEPNSSQISDYVTCISSDEEDDIIDSFHCYFCNGRFRTLRDLGEHEQCCSLKIEHP